MLSWETKPDYCFVQLSLDILWFGNEGLMGKRGRYIDDGELANIKCCSLGNKAIRGEVQSILR